jgi:hypothetical protein
VRRVVEALELLGEPLPAPTRNALTAALRAGDDAGVVRGVCASLDPLCLVRVHINPESRVKATRGAAAAQLVEAGWRSFLVRVDNEAGVTAELRASSPHARRVFEFDPGEPIDTRERWLDLASFGGQPMQPKLGGLELEYRILQLYSRDAGKREARISFNVGQGTQDLGFRNEADILFECLPASEITFQVRDENGQPAMAMFIIRDGQGRVYPSPAKRLAPDFAFHPQVYRGDSETERLPPGEYLIEYTRGPEYRSRVKKVRVGTEPTMVAFQLERWIDPSTQGWWSGDHHLRVIFLLTLSITQRGYIITHISCTSFVLVGSCIYPELGKLVTV